MTYDTSGRVVVPLSKRKIVLAVLGCAVFVALAVAFWPALDGLPSGQWTRWKLIAALSATIAFFGAGGLYLIRKLFDREPGLVIDDEGIVDNASGVSAGRIPWSHIKGFHVTTVKGQRFLTIDVHSPEIYIERAPPLKRPLVRVNAAYFGSPIQIGTATLRIDFDELHSILTRWFETRVHR